MPSPAALLTRARQRRPFLDHLVRMVQRYQADAGDRLAAGVTFYWFLSLFPILLLAVAILGYVYDGPGEAQRKVQSALGSYLPGPTRDTIVMVLTNAKKSAGILGVVGLLLSGLGWIDALREAIRSLWHQNVTAGNVVVRKLVDIVVLLGLFATIGASVAVTGIATAANNFALGLVGLDKSPVATVVTVVLTYVLAGFADTLLFLYLLTRLARVRSPLRRVLKAALFGAVGFEVLKVVGAFYVARTTTKGQATYGAFAVLIGLLVFLNLVSRFILVTASFAVTAPYDSDVAPSGTADREQARKAGIPQEFADADPDDPPNLREQGAPSPLLPAVQGRTPPQDEPEGRHSTGASGGSSLTPQAATGRRRAGGGPSGAAATGGTAAAPALRGEAATRRAANIGAGVIGLGLAAVLAYALRTVWGALRRR